MEKKTADFDWSVPGPLDDMLETLKQQQLAEEREVYREEVANKLREEQEVALQRKKQKDRQKLYDQKIEQFKPSKYSGYNRNGMVAMKTLSVQVRSEMVRRAQLLEKLQSDLAELKSTNGTSQIEIDSAKEKLEDFQQQFPTSIVELFNQLDVDGSRSLDPVEWLDGLKRLGVDLSKEEIELTFSLFDSNKDGKMSYKEFAKIVANDSIKTDRGVAVPPPSRTKAEAKSPSKAMNRRGSELALRRKSMLERVTVHSKKMRQQRIQAKSPQKAKRNVQLPSILRVSGGQSTKQAGTRDKFSVLPPGPRGPRNRLSKFRVMAIENHARTATSQYKRLKSVGVEEKVGEVLLAAPTRPHPPAVRRPSVHQRV